jgi:hypothetical protein
MATRDPSEVMLPTPRTAVVFARARRVSRAEIVVTAPARGRRPPLPADRRTPRGGLVDVYA